MGLQPYDPFRRRPRRPYRAPRRIPVSALGAVAVLPAILISVIIFARSGGDDVPAVVVVAGAAGTPVTTPSTEALTTPESADPTVPPPRSLGIDPPELTAEAAIVVDDASMTVLYGKDSYTPRPPASVTKMATAIVAMEHGRLDEPVTSTLHYWNLVAEGDSTTMGLEPGDTLTLRELLYGLMLVSGNDAAAVIAQHISGSEEAFVAEMNALAARLGMEETHFANVDGLSAPGHVSSPWDLVLLSRYLMRFPDLRTIVGTEEHVASGERDGETVTYDLYNHNPLLNYTPGVDGIKTGFTEEAGRTFAISVERDGHRVYIVLMDTVLRAQDAQALIEWTYENHVWPGETESQSEGDAVAP